MVAFSFRILQLLEFVTCSSGSKLAPEAVDFLLETRYPELQLSHVLLINRYVLLLLSLRRIIRVVVVLQRFCIVVRTATVTVVVITKVLVPLLPRVLSIIITIGLCVYFGNCSQLIPLLSRVRGAGRSSPRILAIKPSTPASSPAA